MWIHKSKGWKQTQQGYNRLKKVWKWLLSLEDKSSTYFIVCKAFAQCVSLHCFLNMPFLLLEFLVMLWLGPFSTFLTCFYLSKLNKTYISVLWDLISSHISWSLLAFQHCNWPLSIWQEILLSFYESVLNSKLSTLGGQNQLLNSFHHSLPP